MAELKRKGDLYLINGTPFSRATWRRIKQIAEDGTELTTVRDEDGQRWQVAYGARGRQESFFFHRDRSSVRFEVDGLDFVKAGWLSPLGAL